MTRLLAAAAAATCALLLSGVAAAMLPISDLTVPALAWSARLNANGGWPPVVLVDDLGSVYRVEDQTLNIVNGGAVTQRIKLTNDTTSLCFPPTLYTPAAGLSTLVYVACTPNIVMAFERSSATAAPLLFRTPVQSDVLLPANAATGRNASYVPVWDQGVEFTVTAGGQTLLFVSGSGALFSLDASTGAQARAQLGPFSTDLFGATTPATLLQPLVRTSTSGVMFLAASGSALVNHTATTKASFALLRFTIPTNSTGAWTPLGASYTFGDATYPTVTFSSMVGLPSAGSRAYFALLLLNPSPYAEQSQLWYFADEEAATIPVHFRCDQLRESMHANFFQESADGAYLMPTTAGEALPVFHSSNGSTAQWYSLASLPSLQYSTVLLDSVGSQIFLAAEGALAVASFNPASPTFALTWWFDAFESILPPNKYNLSVVTFPAFLADQRVNSLAILPSGTGGAQTLLVYSSAVAGSAQAPSDTLWSFSSRVSDTCDVLFPRAVNGTVDDGLCNTCDTAHGTLTPRRCAYCVASKECTDVRMVGMAPLANQTCSDAGYPLSIDAACGSGGGDDSGNGPASKLVAILVGCGVGVAVIAAAAICYLSKKKQTSSSYADI